MSTDTTDDDTPLGSYREWTPTRRVLLYDDDHTFMTVDDGEEWDPQEWAEADEESKYAPWPLIEVPDELVARWKAAMAEICAVDQALRPFYEAGP